MNEIFYLNGLLVPSKSAKVSVKDMGFLYGFGLFETMRTYNGEVFHLESHLNRLGSSAEFLGLSVNIAELEDAVGKTVEANGIRDARVRITISAGEGKYGQSNKYTHPTVLITAEHYHPYSEEVYQGGFRAVISPIRRNSHSPITSLKTSNYLESLISRQQARAVGADEAIFLNEQGLIAEASMSNIFLVINNVLKTPDRNSGILPGITRDLILEIASASEIKTAEEALGPDELFEGQEAFLTNSLIEVMPLTWIEGRPVASGKPGAITRKLMSAYRDMVRNHCSG